MVVLASVLSAAGRAAEAGEAATDALRISEAREHAVFAQQARDLLASQSAVVVADRH